MYHFPETYELVEEVKQRYNVPVTVYKPEGCESAQDFEKKYGEKLWERDEEMYDFAVKVRLRACAVAGRLTASWDRSSPHAVRTRTSA